MNQTGVKNSKTKFLKKFLNNNIIKHYSRYTYLGAVFAERFNRIVGDLPKRPVFEKIDSNWVDILPKITKQYNNRVHSSSKISPMQASLKKGEGYAYRNLLDKRKNIKPKFQVNDLVRTAEIRRIFSKGIQLIGVRIYMKIMKI